VRELKEHYERKGVNNKELKDGLTIVLNELLEPKRQRRAKCEGNMPLVREALEWIDRGAPFPMTTSIARWA
jgi:tryptophanyl-tRNA synthetase